MNINQRGLQTVIIPISEQEYLPLIDRPGCFKNYLDEQYEKYPEIFPKALSIKGYSLSGYARMSDKIPLKRRVIEVGSKDYLIHPCFVMPHLSGYTIEVSKGLELRRYHVPYHAIAGQYGNNSMYWYRLELALSRNSLVGTTIKSAGHLPKDIIIDEHHNKLNGEKVYVATTVAADCILGASVCASIGFEDLRTAYGIYAHECRHLDLAYQPQTVNIDGFRSTRKVAEHLYPESQLILCFLHGFLKVKTKATSDYEDYFEVIRHKIWQCYKAESKRSCAQKFRRMEEWVTQVVPQSAFKTAVLDLCKKKASTWMLMIIRLVKEQVVC